MRKVILNMMVSLDGFMEGPDKELDWHVVDDEFNEYGISVLNAVDTILFGRVTYQFFENYWPAAAKDPGTSKIDLEIAEKINNINKIVFSTTLKDVEWENSKLLKNVIPDEINKLKQESGKDMVIFGGAGIAQSFINLNLIDEYRIIVNPVVLGKGKTLFENINKKFKLKLMKTKVFNSGVVILYYQPDK